MADTANLPLATAVKAAQGWDEMTRQLMLAGKYLQPMPTAQQVPENHVSGCQSEVWLAACPQTPGHFVAYSSAKIIRGVLAVLLEKAHSLESQQLVQFDFANYLAELGISRQISQSRADGVAQVVKTLHALAGTAA